MWPSSRSPRSRAARLRRSVVVVLAVGVLVTAAVAVGGSLSVTLAVVAMTAGVIAGLEVLAGRAEQRHARSEADERTLQFEAELRHQADHDGLTGLPNRRPLMDSVVQALDEVQGAGGPVALLLLDIDRFKVVNDSLGHVAGDELLVAMTARLSAALRPTDRVARFGSDEFLVLCAGVDDPTLATEIADRLRAEVGGQFELDHGDVFVTVSIGVAVAQGGEQAEQLLRDADTAVYEAKAAGRDRVHLSDTALRHRAIDRLEIERALRSALDGDEIRLHYQPIVDLVTGQVLGVEALVRWEHPGRGLLLPADFLCIAEETGLIIELGRWILTEACHLADDCLVDPNTQEPLPLYVNLSARQLADGGLVSMVSEVIDLTGIDPTVLHLEITEDALVADATATSSTLLALRELGVHLALDDFGTGHSSLAYLKQFPVEVLKIDRTFIQGLGPEDLIIEPDDTVHRNGDAAITQAIVNVADLLGLSTVAEGVECAEQAEVLTMLGCRVGQGFHFARPMPEVELRALLAGGPTQQ